MGTPALSLRTPTSSPRLCARPPMQVLRPQQLVLQQRHCQLPVLPLTRLSSRFQTHSMGRLLQNHCPPTRRRSLSLTPCMAPQLSHYLHIRRKLLLPHLRWSWTPLSTLQWTWRSINLRRRRIGRASGRALTATRRPTAPWLRFVILNPEEVLPQ